MSLHDIKVTPSLHLNPLLLAYLFYYNCDIIMNLTKLYNHKHIYKIKAIMYTVGVDESPLENYIGKAMNGI